MKRKLLLYHTKRIIALCLTAGMVLGSAPAVFAEEGGDASDAADTSHSYMTHPLNEENNWDISKELIMPGEEFYTVPKLKIVHSNGYYGQDVTETWLQHASLVLGEDLRVYSDKLVRNTADMSKITQGRQNTYNIWRMSDESIPSSASQKGALLTESRTVNLGYVNNTNTPIVLEQVRTTATECEGELTADDNDILPVAVAYSTNNSDCTICFYEPYYLLSYEGLLDGEDTGLPDRYYLTHDMQTLELPDLVRPGCKFIEWRGGLYFADQTHEDGKTIYKFNWENNLAKAGYNFGDETLSPYFTDGYTVTFHPNGGTIDGKESAIYEIDPESETVFDIGKCVPVREGYTFLGWCLKPSAYYDSLITDTTTYNWMRGIGRLDIQLYAKWAEESDEELEKNGYRLNEATGELTILTQKGMDAWNELCNETDYACKDKVKSLVVRGDVTTVDAYAFCDCKNLKTAVFSENVKKIHTSAFRDCTALETIDLQGIKEISSTAFSDCTSLTKVTFPDTLEYIWSRAFYNCSNLKTIVFEKQNEDETKGFSISDDTFENCHTDFKIYVQASMLDVFKQKYLPEYADRITVKTAEVEEPDVPVTPVTPETPVTPSQEDPCASGHQPQQSVTKASTDRDGAVTTTCAVCKTILSTEVIPKASQIALSADTYTYDGKVKNPTVSVKDTNGKILDTTQYSISYPDGRKNVGIYTVSVTLQGNYEGTLQSSFTIVPKAVSFKKVTAGKKKLTLKWKKQTKQVNGYQIAYATDKKFKKSKQILVKSEKTASKTITKLKGKQKYYVRIRTYKNVKANGKTTKLFSAWSKVKNVKVK